MRPEDTTLNFGVGSTAGQMDFFMIDDKSDRNTFDRATAEAFIASYPQFSSREIRKIPLLTLDDIIDSYCNGKWPDLLSLDAEGLDYAILQASRLNAATGPKIVCVETISGGNANVGAPMAALLTERGYIPAGRTVANVIWTSP